MHAYVANDFTPLGNNLPVLHLPSHDLHCDHNGALKKDLPRVLLCST